MHLTVNNRTASALAPLHVCVCDGNKSTQAQVDEK